jgi:RES domain-containing protein
MVYTAESRSLASLEVLVHTEDTLTLASIRWVTIPVGIEESLIETLAPLPEDWNALPVAPSSRAMGSRWAVESRFPVLRVPSAVMSGEFNYLLNPRHPNFSRLAIGEPQRFSFDPRLS